MKTYSELNTEELIRANLAGEYGDIKIDSETRIQNLRILVPQLQRQLVEYKETYKQCEGETDSTVVSWVKWVDSLRELLIKAEKVAGICGPGGVPMSIVNNPEGSMWLGRWRGSDGKVDPERYMKLLESHGIAGDITVDHIKVWCKVRFGDEFECRLCKGTGYCGGLKCNRCKGSGKE
jgi:hypothetical protein